MTDEKITDTKSQIFKSALRLFASKGYENVSMRMIAGKVGIKAASIYNHFSSKEEILSFCYDYYEEHRRDGRLTSAEYLPIIQNGTKEEVIKVLIYTFPEEISEIMVQSVTLMFARLYADKRAKELYMGEINDSIAYLHEFLNAGIEAGRFREFNIPAVSWIFISSRLFAAQFVTINPKQRLIWKRNEQEVFDELLHVIPFVR